LWAAEADRLQLMAGLVGDPAVLINLSPQHGDLGTQLRMFAE
jgi:hypothetical protein